MRKHNRSCGASATAKQKCNFGARLRQNAEIKYNKRGYSAEGYSLLTSALRPRLFGVSIAIGTVAIIGTSLGMYSNNTSAVSATLSIPDNVSVNANPTVDSGFAESSNDAISVSTGNLNGYTLTIKAKDNDQLKNGSNVLNSISTNLTAEQYRTGSYANTWGFKPSEINNNANTSYVPGPDNITGITLASTHASSNDAENYSIGIAAKVDSNTIAGNYTNTFTIVATANEATYTINFNNNGGTGGPSKAQTGDIGSSTFVNIVNEEGDTPSLSGKDFLGWCSVNPGTGDTCNGVLVQSGGQFPLCKCDLNITLYAMYGKKVEDPNKEGADCYIAGYEGKRYAGLCWMWQDVSGNYTWEQAKSACPSNTHLPSLGDFEALLNAIGRGNQLYEAGWSGYNYWSSTDYSDTYAYTLYINTRNGTASVSTDAGKQGSRKVRCVSY